MKIHHYNATTGEFISEGTAENDPLQGFPMIPAHATEQAPPVTGTNQVAKWNGAAWEIVPDYRGEFGYDANGERQEVKEIDVLPDPTWTATPPPLTTEQKIQAITASIQAVLDDEARSRNYDDINSIGKYIGYDNAFRVECEALGVWTANVWLKAYELLAVWEQTGQEITADEVLAQLPAMV